MPTIGDTISFMGTLSIGFVTGGGGSAPALGVFAGPVATAGELTVACGAEAPLCSFKRKPSFSISNTERSCFFIKSIIDLISLMSLGSKAIFWLRLKRFR